MRACEQSVRISRQKTSNARFFHFNVFQVKIVLNISNYIKIYSQIIQFVVEMSDQSDKNFTEMCSERTIFSEQQGFFGEMFEIVKNCCTKKWLKEKFEASPTDADKLRLLFDEPNVSDMLLGTLEHVTSIYRKKDAAFSHQRRKDGERLHQQNDFENASMLLTHAVLRAPAKGEAKID